LTTRRGTTKLALSFPKGSVLMAKNVNDWNRLAKDAYVGGAIRDYDDHGRMVHRRIAKVDIEPGTASFRFDRVAVRVRDGVWANLPIEGNDFMWFPSAAMDITFDADGVARLGSAVLPSHIDAVYPATALPADSPTFAPPVTN
jgi:hypothetical protein